MSVYLPCLTMVGSVVVAVAAIKHGPRGLSLVLAVIACICSRDRDRRKDLINVVRAVSAWPPGKRKL